LSSTSPALPRKPSVYVTPAATTYSTLPRMHSRKTSSFSPQETARHSINSVPISRQSYDVSPQQISRQSYEIRPSQISRHSVSSTPIEKVTARTYCTDTSYATLPKMSTNVTHYQKTSYHPNRNDLTMPAGNHRFAQAISAHEHGSCSPSYGRTSPIITSSYQSSYHSSPGIRSTYSINDLLFCI